MNQNERDNELIEQTEAVEEKASEEEALNEPDTAAENEDESSDEEEKREPVYIRFKVALLGCVLFMLSGMLLALLLVPNALRVRIFGSSAVDKLSAIEMLVEENYIYLDEIDEQQMNDMLATGYIYGLGDKYSAYYPAEQYTEVMQSNAGQSYGIGISCVLYEEAGGMYVVNVTIGSPADAAGVKKGDIITHVDDAAVTAENFNQLVDAIRGDLGTPVNLSVTRADGTQTVLSPIRGEFTATSAWGEMLGSIGYIKISAFNEATVLQFNDTLDSLIENGAEGLVIDLRGNSGGLVNSATDMLDVLLPECDLGYAVYNDGKRKALARSDKSCVDLPISVIVDNDSASSSELFAAAMRDKGGAKLVGNTTFGKGIMQSTFALGDGSAVRLTVAEIYTAGGNRYHGIGLTPDVEVTLTEEQSEKWFLLSGESDPYIAAAIACLN